MTHAVYVYSGYLLTFAILAAYAAWIVGRTRALQRQLRPQEPEGHLAGRAPGDGLGGSPLP